MIDKFENLREYNFHKLGLRLLKIMKINHGTISCVYGIVLCTT